MSVLMEHLKNFFLPQSLIDMFTQFNVIYFKEAHIVTDSTLDTKHAVF